MEDGRALMWLGAGFLSLLILTSRRGKDGPDLAVEEARMLALVTENYQRYAAMLRKDGREPVSFEAYKRQHGLR